MKLGQIKQYRDKLEASRRNIARVKTALRQQRKAGGEKK
jgi:ribosomal protein L29